MRTTFLLSAAALVAASAAGAQLASGFAGPRPIRGLVGGSLTVAQPVGDFGDAVDVGGGFSVFGLVNAGPDSPLGLRLDAGFLVYGSQDHRVQLSPTIPAELIGAKLNTTNSIFFLGVGPQLMATGGPLRPYVNGSVGYTWFVTNSSLSGVEGNESLFPTKNKSDGAFTWGGAAGFYIPLSRRAPVALDRGARYHATGEVEYLTEDGVQWDEGPPVRVTLSPRTSVANMITYHIGVSVGLPTPGRR